MRDKEELAEVEVTLCSKRGPLGAKERSQRGEMCSIYDVCRQTMLMFKEGDHGKFFTRELKTRSL